MWVESNLIIPDKAYAPLEIVEMALDLIPTSKRLLGSDTSQGNTELSRAWTAPSKHILDQVIIDRYKLVYHKFKTKWTYNRLRLNFDPR